MTVKAIVFDYKTLFSRDPTVIAEMQVVLRWAQDCGLRICILTTDPMDVGTSCTQHGYPAPDLHVQQADIPGRKNRGSPAWIDVVTSGLAVANHDLLYVGSTSMDWRTAINSGVFYFHAKWCGPNRDTCIVIESPRDIAGHITQFLMPEPRFSFRYDDPGRKLALRSLLPASATLPAGPPSGSFKLQDVFTYHRAIAVGQSKASNMLTFHAISSLYVEGMLPKGSLFCVYPGSKVGKLSEELEQFVKPAASLVHGYYKDDLLVRAVEAPDTSLARVRARSAGLPSPVSIENQIRTVHLGAKYRGRVKDKTVIVFDDFTTTGASLEWARNLFVAAGAHQVIALTIGKYSTRYSTHDPKPGVSVDPFTLSTLGLNDFTEITHHLPEDSTNPSKMANLFNREINDLVW
ncbi:phosphoribosyltransferase [Actinoplanes philippinensis]|uniref:phosphoribosyltransferase n=1 Tax=Actinoplanes philippinensis TaxID=35752 RepID=UPI0033C87CA9